MVNYYDILGIPKNASPEDIKRAYKKLAVKHHPDKGGDEKKFQDINNAYDVLTNKEKKENYDRTGDENRRGGMGPTGPTGPNPHDIFAHFFGRGHGGHPGNQHMNRSHKCNDIIHTYKISLRDAFNGVKKQIKIKTKAYHFDKLKECENCQGTGKVKNVKNMGVFTQIFETACDLCKGTGIIDKDNSASYDIEKLVHLIIPKGVNDGHNIIHKELGEQPKRKIDKPGDLIFKIQVLPNDVFTRIGNDLHSSIKIDFISSITGANIRYNIMDEDIFEFNTNRFNIVYPDKKYKIENKGMYINDNKRGDLYLTFDIEYPILSNEQRDKIRQILHDELNS
jgi:DnaJ family protein A protein 2